MSQINRENRGRLTLRLPETLHQQLTNLAAGEEIYCSKEDVAKQQESFGNLFIVTIGKS